MSPLPVPVDAGVAATFDALWPGDDPLVRLHAATPPAGDRVVESFLAVPSVGRARFLLPAGDRRLAVRTLTQYNAMRAPRTRLNRLGVAAGVALTGGAGLAQPLHVTVDDAVPRAAEADHLLTSYLGGVLGPGRVRYALGVRPLTPNVKPSLQAFGERGEPVAYGKVGWNATTRRQVEVEAAALGRVGPRLRRLHAPQLRHAGSWRGRALVVTVPMPSGLRAWPDPTIAPTADVVEEVAATGSLSRQPVGGSTGLARLAEAATAEGWDPQVRTGYATCLAAVQAHGDVTVRSGAWHGDWTPWNLAVDGDTAWAWDWEHYADDRAVGLDTLHWHLQVGLHLDRAPMPEALRRARAAALPMLVQLQGSRDAARLCEALHLLEVAARHETARAEGAGASPTLAPHLAAALADTAQALGDRS